MKRKNPGRSGKSFKPCPWCGPGTQLDVEVDIRFDSRHVVCLTCQCRGPMRVDIHHAEHAWNQRAKEKQTYYPAVCPDHGDFETTREDLACPECHPDGWPESPFRRFQLMEIRQAARAECTCGGGGPNDGHTCPACQVWHRLVSIPLEVNREG